MSNFEITRFTGIDYDSKTARWEKVAERSNQENALATCKSLNKKRPYYHRVEVLKSVELPKFTVLKPNMKSDYAPIVIPASFTVRKKIQKRQTSSKGGIAYRRSSPPTSP